MENAQRKREILDVCLATFIRRGLYETSVRDLSRALALQSGGIYYWFKDKDDVVVTCAEEAALRLEEHLIAPALQDIINVGDTRAYEIGDHVVLLTKDQTVVAREVELGNLTQVEAETDPRRSVLLQCVGASDEV